MAEKSSRQRCPAILVSRDESPTLVSLLAEAGIDCVTVARSPARLPAATQGERLVIFAEAPKEEPAILSLLRRVPDGLQPVFIQDGVVAPLALFQGAVVLPENLPRTEMVRRLRAVVARVR